MQDRFERVIVVDEDDQELGTLGKLEAHEGGGVRHRAFSIFLFDGEGRLLLQRRAVGKYHFGGLWANSCCSHPRPGEATLDAAARRLEEELGIRAELREVGAFEYRATDPVSGYSEWEVDHVLTGTSDDSPRVDPEEVAETQRVSLDELRSAIAANPEQYVPWLAKALSVLQ